MSIVCRKQVAAVVMVPLLLSLGGCPCGFDCNNDSDTPPEPTTLTLGFSDAAVDELVRVVIEVERITFRRTGAQDVIVERFTINELGLVEAESFQIDLLQYRGRNQLLAIEGLALDTATYDEVLISVLDGDINFSFVEQADGTVKPLKLPMSELSLQAIRLNAGAQAFTVEFGLAQALRYQTVDDSYELTTDGVRIEDNAQVASLTGRVDSSLFDSVPPCNEKIDPQAGNRIYLYSARDLVGEELADMVTGDSATALPDNAMAPFAVAGLIQNVLTGNWEYAFGYLPPGSYTLAFSCAARDDNPVDFDGIEIPLPLAQIHNIDLSAGDQAICDLLDDNSCR
jgi:Domain of unknown function (DUF4382)